MMSEAFDPYYSWLGIPPTEQPADYYRLLGLSRFESNAEVIANAAERQIRHVRTFQLGEKAEHSQTLLNELATARTCLMDSSRKAAYDQHLHARMAEQNPPPVASPASATTSTVQRSRRRRPRSPRVEIVKIVAGGIAGLTIGVLLLWYGFGMDVLGVMESRDEGLAKRVTQGDTNLRRILPRKEETGQDATREPTQPEPDARPKQVGAESDTSVADSLPEVPQTDSRTPPLAVAPFDAQKAKVHQKAWADYLGMPVEDTNSIGMTLVLIPPGEFMMGSRESAEQMATAFDAEVEKFTNEYPRHRVTLTKPFYLGIYEVTRGKFAEFVADQNYKTEPERDGEGGLGWNDETGKLGAVRDPKFSWREAGFRQTDQHPVVNVTWNDAVAFCEWLSKKERRSYRLPTEAEWGYACRGGTTSRYQHGNDPEDLATVGNVADAAMNAKWTNYDASNYIKADDGHIFTSPVGQFPANAFGLLVMHGNVREWCQDWYGKDYYDKSTTQNPPGPTVATSRVLRGGSWFDLARGCRSAYRGHFGPSYSGYGNGIRVVCESDQLPMNSASPEHISDSSLESTSAKPTKPKTSAKEANPLTASLTKGLIAYYPFNGNATDESGIGNDGTITGGGVTPTADRFGAPNRAFDFDGRGGHINIGHAAILVLQT